MSLATTGLGTPPVHVAPATGKLRGFRIALTCDRRADDLTAALRRQGAMVLHTPLIRIMPVDQDSELIEATREIIADPPAGVIVTTGIGFRAWLEVAEVHGLSEPLEAVLRSAVIVSRGPKATGALRSLGLREAWAAPTERSAEAVDWAVRNIAPESRVAVQLHGDPDPEWLSGLRSRSTRFQLQLVAPYRWLIPEAPEGVDQLIDAIIRRTVDAVVFTSAPAATEFIRAATARPNSEAVQQALRTVALGAVGPVTAEPLVAAGLLPIIPTRARLGALMRELTDQLATRVRVIPTRTGLLRLRGQLAFDGNRELALGPTGIALLRALADADGGVVPRTTLRDLLPADAASDHALDVAVARMRTRLPDKELVATVVKRGYQLRPM